MTNCSDNTESLCIHGVPIKFGCLSCTPADISIIELDAHVKSLREHNLRHINENRKISRRIEKLESWLYGDGDISALNGRMSNLEKNNEFDDHQRKRLEDKINYLEELIYDVKAKLRESDKKPHRCPICDGRGFYESMVPKEPGRLDFTCKTCEGKGIVWG
jgi:hypothetical protein